MVMVRYVAVALVLFAVGCTAESTDDELTTETEQAPQTDLQEPSNQAPDKAQEQPDTSKAKLDTIRVPPPTGPGG